VRRAAPLLALLLVSCSTHPDTMRTLPPDRGAAVVYVALGDSTVEGVGASSRTLNYVSLLHERLRAVYPGARVANLGVGGATSADVLRRQLDRAIEQRPNLITLSIGPNDITTRVPVEVYEKNLATILSRVRHETAAVVVVNSIPDLAVTPRFSRSRSREAVGRLTVVFNEAVARQARAHGAEFVDLLHDQPTRGAAPAGAHRKGRLSPVRRRIFALGGAGVVRNPVAHRRATSVSK